MIVLGVAGSLRRRRIARWSCGESKVLCCAFRVLGDGRFRSFSLIFAIRPRKLTSGVWLNNVGARSVCGFVLDSIVLYSSQECYSTPPCVHLGSSP